MRSISLHFAELGTQRLYDRHLFSCGSLTKNLTIFILMCFFASASFLPAKESKAVSGDWTKLTHDAETTQLLYSTNKILLRDKS